jgi:hypothetical protein
LRPRLYAVACFAGFKKSLQGPGVQAEEITASPASQASRNHCKGLCAGRRNNCSGLCAGFKKSLQRPGAQAVRNNCVACFEAVKIN